MRAEIDGLRTAVDGARTELKAEFDRLRHNTQASCQPLHERMQIGFAAVLAALAASNTEQQRYFNLVMGSLVAVTVLILGGIAVL